MNSKFMGNGDIRLAGTASVVSRRPMLKLNMAGEGCGALK